ILLQIAGNTREHTGSPLLGMEGKDKNLKIQATCKFPEVKSTMRFGTTFIFIGQPVDVVALKEKINYQ
ncbi:MAG: hypothetical protein RR185_09920, partial [Angelakisella sp.]